MPHGFWASLPQPFFGLAPMVGVTDAAFRRLVASYGKPHVVWTEFTPADGLCAPEQSAAWLPRLAYTEAERPIVAQLYGANPHTMERAAALVAAHGFDGVDINMGCPDRAVERQGAGAALCCRPALAQSLIRAAQRGAGGLPVSVKIRLGYDRNSLDTWLPALLEAEPAVVTIHARTRMDLSLVPARWEAIGEAVAYCRTAKYPVYIVGNGDVSNLTEAYHKACLTGVQGVMLGRAILHNPWVFQEGRVPTAITLEERLGLLLAHTDLFMALYGAHKPFAMLKKYYKAYVTGWPEAAGLYQRLMATQSAAEVEALVLQYLHHGAPTASTRDVLCRSRKDSAAMTPRKTP